MANEIRETPLPPDEYEYMCILTLSVALDSYANYYEIAPPFHHQTAISHADAIDAELLRNDDGTIQEWDSHP